MTANKKSNTSSESNSDGLVLPENTNENTNSNTEEHTDRTYSYSDNSPFPIGTDVDTMLDTIEQNKKCSSISDVYKINIADLNKHSFFPENESLAYNNELLCEQMENAGARFTKDMTNRTKSYADEGGDIQQIQDGYIITDDISFNAPESWYENIVGTLIRGQWFDGEIGGALQFRLIRHNGKRYLTNWSGENRHRGLVSFMRKGAKVIDDNGIITYDKMQRKVMIDWNKQDSVPNSEKINLEKILRTFQVKVKEGKDEFKFLNYKNILKLAETCVECRNFIEKIEKTAYISFKVSNLDDEMVSNDVDLESEQKTSHTLVQKSQEFIKSNIGRDLDREISRRNILALQLQYNREDRKLLPSDQTSEYPIFTHSHSPRMSIVFDGKGGRNFKCIYKARYQGPILSMVNPETAEKTGSFDPLEPWQLKLLKQYDGIPMHNYKQKVDSHIVSLSLSSKEEEEKADEFKSQLAENLRKSAEGVLKVNKVFMDEELNDEGKLIGGKLTSFDPYQIVERMMSKIPGKLKEYCKKKPHGNKREIVRINKENYASQIINFRIPLFVSNGELKMKDLKTFLSRVEDDLYDNMFTAIDAGEYDVLLDNTSDFMLMYTDTSNKNSKKANKSRTFANAKSVGRRKYDERIDEFRVKFIDKSELPNRDLTRMEFLGIMGEADIKTGLDTWAYIFDNELVKIFKDFSPDKRKEDLRSLKSKICTELKGIFADKDAEIPYDRLTKSEYIVVNLVDAQYAPNEVRILESDLDENKLDCQLAHWIAEKHCGRTEHGNFVVPCSSDANNHKSTRNHHLFWYIAKCMETASGNKFYTKLLFDASLKAQGIDISVQEICDKCDEILDNVHSHYESVSDKQDAIEKFKKALVDFDVEI